MPICQKPLLINELSIIYMCHESNLVQGNQLESVGCLVMIAPSILRCTVVTPITTMGPKSLGSYLKFRNPRFNEV